MEISSFLLSKRRQFLNLRQFSSIRLFPILKKTMFSKDCIFLTHFRALVVVVVVDTQQSSSLKPHTATPLPTIHQPEPAVERAEPNRTNDRGSQHTTRAKQKKRREKRSSKREKPAKKQHRAQKKQQASKRGRVECGGGGKIDGRRMRVETRVEVRRTTTAAGEWKLLVV